tara:strand:+ start:44 stop:679 length:636 start_codon:yes stop_codon:yes gene_type:complete
MKKEDLEKDEDFSDLEKQEDNDVENSFQNELTEDDCLSGAEKEEQDDENTLEDVIKENENLKERLMRSLADFENLRKRADRDRKDAEIYGGTKLARDLLSVHDNLSRALENIDDNLRNQNKALVEGIELTQRDLLNVFSNHKIEKIAPTVGEKFNPKLHQAMFEAPVEKTEKGTIIQVMTTGFKIYDRLLRASQVGVSSNENNNINVEEKE